MEVQSKLACFHCGEECDSSPVSYDNKIFCCNGCKTVYELLKDNKLYTYYEFDASPGVKEDPDSVKGRFNYLDSPDVQEQLVNFSQGGISKVTLHIPSIHCSSCIWLLENLQRLNKGIIRSSVNFPKKTIYITYNHEAVSLRQLAEMLDSLHYSPAISYDTLQGKPKRQTNRAILYKLGIAGFAFGNIMLLSFPSYFSSNIADNPGLMKFFHWLNFLLILPVVFYSSTEFFGSAFSNLRKKIINVDLPVAIGIIALFFQSIFELITASGPGYFDSLAGLVFFLLIGRWYQNKTYEALSFERDYKSYFPIAVDRITVNGPETVMLDKVKPGDELQINNNELIPADGVLKQGTAFIDYSFVTGEAVPVPVEKEQKVFAGGRQKGTSIIVSVTKEVSQSYLTQLWNQDIQAEPKKSLSTLLDKIGKHFTIAVIAIAFSALFYWILVEPAKAVFVFTSVLIVACPCALALSAPFGFGTALRVMGSKKLFLRNTAAVERLARSGSIVLDKTGTLTQSGKYQVNYTGKQLDNSLMKKLYSVVRQSGHPLSRAITFFLHSGASVSVDEFMEEPGKGMLALVDDMELILGSKSWLLQNDVEINLSDDFMKAELSSKVFLAVNREFYGVFNLTPQYRKGLEKLFYELGSRYKLWLLSGDDSTEKNILTRFYPHWKGLSFNQGPKEKLRFIRELQHTGDERVIMLGDGLNDAGALSEAFAGIAVTEDLRTFVPASDGILHASRVTSLSSFLKYAQSSLNLIKISIGISFAYNVAGLYFAVSGKLTPILSAILMPLSSVTIVGFVSLLTLWAGRRWLDFK